MISVVWPDVAVTAAAVTPSTRTLAGVAVPWNVPGRVANGDVVIFEPSSLDAAARPVVLRDHDRTRPVGRVVDARDNGATMWAQARIVATPAGDEVLTLAAPPDQVLGMFSVGAEPTDYYYDADGVLHIAAADWQELTVLTIGAYAAARITQVAAAPPAPNGGPMPPTLSDEPTTEPDELPDELPEPDTVPEPDAASAVETGAVAVPVTAGAGRNPRRPRGQYDAVTIRDLARMIAVSRGDERAARFVAAALAVQGPLSIEAALADVTLVGTNSVGALFRPAYQAELVELISWGTPTIDAIRQGDLQRGDYPSKTFNVWDIAPLVQLQAGEKDPIFSTEIRITPKSAPVNTWTGGNDISQQTIDLGSPSFVEDYIRASAIDYARKVDTYAVTTLLAAAADVPTLATDTFIQIVAKLVGALSPATTPPGGLFLAMSYDMGVGLIGVPRDEGPAFWDGNVNFGAFLPSTTVGGLSAFVDPNMPARTFLLGHRQGSTWYDLPGTPFNLRAINVANLGLDVAVYGYGALGIQYPGSLTKTTVPAP